MPIQPNDRHQQDPARQWRATGAAGRFPAQPRHRARRTSGALSWAELDALPAGTSSLRHLNAH
ncbi:DNA repair protein [Micromonospora sp. NPDC047527]|uniref:DNA repair protein n=1 Tax=Micromonospora sp. NPDC047527 TaxID=3155144 RepID=UPI0033D44FC8